MAGAYGAAESPEGLKSDMNKDSLGCYVGDIPRRHVRGLA